MVVVARSGGKSAQIEWFDSGHGASALGKSDPGLFAKSDPGDT
jgi:hypothetical protein